MPTTGSKIVITGGAGFIGTHLAERLHSANSLVLLDNLRRDSLKSAPALQGSRNVRLEQADILDKAKVRAAFDGAETVVHMAAIAGVSSYYKQPLDTLRVNLLGTVNALECAHEAGVKRFIYVSTSEVFGPNALWVSEDSAHQLGGVADKRWVYATSKLAGEQFVQRFGEEKGLATTIARPFNIYGPRQTGEGAISNFCTAVIRKQPMTVYGDGSALRAWCYVSDFVDAVVAMLERPEAKGQVFNIGNPAEVCSTIGLARAMQRVAAGTAIRYQDVQRAEVQARIPVIDRARKLLGFEPKVSLDEGLARTLEWFRATQA